MDDSFDPVTLAQEMLLVSAGEIDQLYSENNKDYSSTISKVKSLQHERAFKEI
jgi:hypothetical protein